VDTDVPSAIEVFTTLVLYKSTFTYLLTYAGTASVFKSEILLMSIKILIEKQVKV